MENKHPISKGRNWLVWQEKHRPMSCLTGKQSGWNRNLSSWFEASQFILNSAEKYHFGYCFSEEQPFVGLDIDACRNPVSGEIKDWAVKVIEALRPHTVLENISVSGTGVKLIVQCDENVKRAVRYVDSEGFGDHEPQIELFSNSKYFALTDFGVPDLKYVSSVDVALLSRILDADIAEAPVKESKASGGETSPEELRELLSKLDVFEFQGRGEWLKIMQASHHATGGSEAGKDVFKKWSSGDEANYSESDVERDWGSLKLNAARPVTVGTIIAKISPEDRPRIKIEDEFEAIKAPATRKLTWLLRNDLRTHDNFVKQFTEEMETLRYVTEWGKWIVYSDGKWVLDASGHYKHRAVLDYVDDMRDRVPNTTPDEYEKALLWVSQLGNWNNTNAILKQLNGSVLAVSSKRLEQNKHLLNFRNGTYDLGADKFRPHDLKDFCMQQCETDYVEGQVATKWIEAVGQIFGGDQELVTYVRRLLGKSLVGVDDSPTFNIFFGDGCNGKSTVVQTIGSLLGSYSCSLPSEMFDSRKELHPQYYAKLFGTRLAMFAEMESDVPLAEGSVKKLTSVDEIEARRMYEQSWSFTPSHTSVICTNHKPKVKGKDSGIWRRLRLIPFEVDLSDRKDVTLMQKLKGEYAGIANWLIEGYREYVKNGEGFSQAVSDATEEYRNDEDDFKDLADELFELVEVGVVSGADAHSHYQRSGGRLGRKSFITNMQRLGYEYKRVQHNGVRARRFTNVKFVSEFGEI